MWLRLYHDPWHDLVNRQRGHLKCQQTSLQGCECIQEPKSSREPTSPVFRQNGSRTELGDNLKFSHCLITTNDRTSGIHTNVAGQTVCYLGSLQVQQQLSHRPLWTNRKDSWQVYQTWADHSPPMWLQGSSTELPGSNTPGLQRCYSYFQAAHPASGTTERPEHNMSSVKSTWNSIHFYLKSVSIQKTCTADMWNRWGLVYHVHIGPRNNCLTVQSHINAAGHIFLKQSVELLLLLKKKKSYKILTRRKCFTHWV